jgi:hypothetical protein
MDWPDSLVGIEIGLLHKDASDPIVLTANYGPEIS